MELNKMFKIYQLARQFQINMKNILMWPEIKVMKSKIKPNQF